MFIMMMTAIFISMIFVLANHPLSMGLLLLIQTVMISIITGFINFNWWFSYILFLIMVGGMLVLFIYMTSIASNEKFKFSIKSIPVITLVSMWLIYMYQFSESSLMNSSMNYINSFNNFTLNKFLMPPSNMILIMIIIYLLIALIAVVKISKSSQGPLRQMN